MSSPTDSRETVGLTPDHMAQLFGEIKKTISEHIRKHGSSFSTKRT